MKNKIQIKSICGKILFEFEKENNTIKDTLENAVKQKVNLSGADLCGANLQDANLGNAILFESDLCGANLQGADLRDADLYGAAIGRANLQGADLRRTCLSSADLGDANLQDADLSHADLTYANLSGAHLRRACLSWAALRWVNLSFANLSYANLTYANLSCADLREANIAYSHFSYANLGLANLKEANLCGANIIEAERVPYIPLNCPSEGSFVGWKKVKDKLVKLEIPEDAKRSSATTRKCRCDKAKVLLITDLDGSNPIDEILNTSQEHKVLYKVGEMVYPDSFDENRWNGCSHGIHFFINKQDAINY